MSGELIKEIEEEIHQEEWWAFWRTYGWLIGGLVVLTLCMTGGYLWWNSRQQSNLEMQSTQYEEALDLLARKGPNGTSKDMLEKLSQGGAEGYRLLAQLQLFKLEAQAAGRDESARVAAEKRADSLLRVAQKNRDSGIQGVMVLNKATMALNSGRPIDEATRQHLATYHAPQNPWKSLAFEMQGLEALQQGQGGIEALKIYDELMADSEVTPPVKMRANMALIGSGQANPQGRN